LDFIVLDNNWLAGFVNLMTFFSICEE